MLDEITASNLGLIARTEVTLDPGLTVITGETGTGKTLMLGALRLLRGDKAGKGFIGPAGDRCEVAGRFIVGDTETVARRTVDAQRSRAYLDDTAISVGGLSDAMADRIAIVGQHDQLTITTSAGVRRLIDGCMTSGDRSAVEAYTVSWDMHQALRSELEALSGDTRTLERELDLLQYQVEEIDAMALEPDEAEDLRHRLVHLRNAEGLVAEFDAALALLGEEGAAGPLAAAAEHLRAASALDDDLTPQVERLGELLTELSDVSGELAIRASSLETDGVALAAAEERQAAINDLRRKYGDTVKDILTFRDDAAHRAAELEDLLAAAATIEDRLADADRRLREAGSEVRAIRMRIAGDVSTGASSHLRDLGFRDPIVSVTVEEAEPASHGCDRTTVLFASDAELTPGPVSTVASGGELSRLVLALTLAAGSHGTALVAFDEVDAGVGGETALSMGRKLKQLSESQQVVCVTHLPQVAAFGDRHIVVERDGTEATVETVDGEARIEELSRMLAGLTESEKGREHASELLAIASDAS